jgi:hypothetical protein
MEGFTSARDVDGDAFEGAAEHGIATVVVGWGYGKSDFDTPLTAPPAAHVATVEQLREVLGV